MSIKSKILILAIAISCLGVKLTIPTAIAENYQQANSNGVDGDIDSLTNELERQCNTNPRKLRTVSDLRVRVGIHRGVHKLTLGGGNNDPEHSYHCCDGEGKCSGPVDTLTICPVIKVWCREENSSCICD